jgi:hypothetical protein
VDFGSQIIALLSAAVAAVVILRRDRTITVTPTGVQNL